jgi:hypothetical protein
MIGTVYMGPNYVFPIVCRNRSISNVRVMKGR